MLQTGSKKYACNGAFRQGIYEQDVTALFYAVDPPSVDLALSQDIYT